MRQGVTLTLHVGSGFQPQHHTLHHFPPPSTGWKSPVPYLFGGLAAMLGLIAFALLILACSYWKLSGHHDGGAGEDSGGGATSDEKPKDAATSAYLNSILVIMAGDEKPTFLATPVTNRVLSFGDAESQASSSGGDEKEEKELTVVIADDEKR